MWRNFISAVHRRRIVLVVAILAWATIVGGGIAALTRYQMTPGAPAHALDRWPAQNQMQLASDRPTLVMFLHPYCACSRASLEELNEMLAQVGNQVATRIVFFKAINQLDDWGNTDLWRGAQAIPRAAVIRDDGSDAGLVHLFGARTSGQVFLYSPRGQLLFSGGITGSRGHVGDNDGFDRLVAAIGGRADGQNAHAQTPLTSPVFGCALEDTSAPKSRERF